MTTPDTTPDPLAFLTCAECGRTMGGHSLDCSVLLASAPEDLDDEPVPTPTERARELYRRAKEAQDRLGWADPKDHMEVTHATVDLARVVTDLARELRQLITDRGAS